MKKKLPIAVAAIAALAVTLAATYQPADYGMEAREHGTIITTLGSPVLGDPDAPLTIVEFGDYQCHKCYEWFHETKPAITSNYIDTGKANLVFVDMAFLGSDSPTAAQATYCADDQGMYWEYHDALYNAQESRIDGGWAAKDRLKAIAFTMGMDPDEFDGCLDSEKYKNRVQYNTNQARQNGVTGTPGFFIVGQDGQEMIPGAQPYSSFQRVLDSML